MEPDKICQPRTKRVAQPYSTTTADDQPTHRTVAQASAEVAQIKRAVAGPGTATPDTLLLMQQRYGNQAVQRLIQRKANPLVATVQRGLFGSKQKVPIHIEDVIRSDIFGYFAKFCEEVEHSPEGTNFIKDYRAFKANPKLNLAQQIYDQYIDQNSKNEQSTPLNITKKMVDEVAYHLTKTTFKENMFDDIYEHVKKDLAQPYDRFTNDSELFQEWQSDW